MWPLWHLNHDSGVGVNRSHEHIDNDVERGLMSWPSLPSRGNGLLVDVLRYQTADKTQSTSVVKCCKVLRSGAKWRVSDLIVPGDLASVIC